MNGKVIHIGIAVRDAKQAVRSLAQMIGLEEPPLFEYKTDTLHYRIGTILLGELELEIIEPLTKSGMADEHIRDFGQGVYHIAVGVPNLLEALCCYKQRGIEHHEIRTGIYGNAVCFLKNHIIPGIFLELVETTPSNPL